MGTQRICIGAKLDLDRFKNVALRFFDPTVLFASHKDEDEDHDNDTDKVKVCMGSRLLPTVLCASLSTSCETTLSVSKVSSDFTNHSISRE